MSSKDDQVHAKSINFINLSPNYFSSDDVLFSFLSFRLGMKGKLGIDICVHAVHMCTVQLP